MKNLTFILSALIIIAFVQPQKVKVQIKVQAEEANLKVAGQEAELDYKPASGLTALDEIPNGQEWQIIAHTRHPTLVAQIYKGESSFGAHDICRARGGYNGFGFAEWTGHSPTCFNSFEEVVQNVDTWIEDKIQKGFSPSEMSCYYIKGLRTEDCDTSYSLKKTP